VLRAWRRLSKRWCLLATYRHQISNSHSNTFSLDWLISCIKIILSKKRTEVPKLECYTWWAAELLNIVAVKNFPGKCVRVALKCMYSAHKLCALSWNTVISEKTYLLSQISMFHRAFSNSIIDKHQHMHFFTFKTVLI